MKAHIAVLLMLILLVGLGLTMSLVDFSEPHRDGEIGQLP